MQCTRYILLIIVASIYSAGPLIANPTDTFQVANEAMKNGNLGDAIQLYEGLVSNGFGTADLHYNLGTAYLQEGTWVNARIHLERAKYLAPLNEDVETNLDFVRDKIGDYYAFPKYPLVGVVESLRTFLGRFAIPLSFLLIFIALFSLLILHQRQATPITRWALLGMGALLVGILPLLLAHTALERQQANMIIATTTGGLSEIPEDGGVIKEEIAAGIKLHIEEDYGTWLRVTTASGAEGWFKREQTRSLL